MEIHSHAYTHYTYRSYRQNVFNLKKADDALARAGATKNAFCSPYGRWNAAIQRAVDEAGYAFSSEFSYDYDGVPSYPVIEGRRSRVLQVPVHPVGLGVYLEAAPAYDEREADSYFLGLFERKYRQGEPLIFYDHPTTWLGVHPEYMEKFFRAALAKKDVWIAGLGEWARWWERRHAVEWSAYAGEDGIEIRLKKGASGDLPLSAHLYDGNGRVAACRLGEKDVRVSIAGLAWETAPEPEDPRDEGNVVKRSSFKRWLKRRLDWETSTPVQEIVRDSPAAMVKFFLRSVAKKA
jgi:hypothetical protein